MNLRKLKATLDAAGGTLPLPLIKNKKTVNPRDADSPPVFQLVRQRSRGRGGGFFGRVAAGWVPLLAA